jgi:hypothetical protein
VNKPRIQLQYDGEQIAEWDCPRGWLPQFGTILAVSYRGRTRLFRAVSQFDTVVVLDLV